MPKPWFDIRVKTEASKFDSVRSKILGWPEEVAEEVYWPALASISRDGVDYMRYIILSSATPTGEQRAASGGNGPGRVNSGTMYDAVSARNRKRAKGFSSFVGWTEGKPGYAIFQEQGTKNGVVAMNAVGQAQEYMLSQIRALAAGRYEGSDIGFNEEGDE